jgi:hypothetical protein
LIRYSTPNSTSFRRCNWVDFWVLEQHYSTLTTPITTIESDHTAETGSLEIIKYSPNSFNKCSSFYKSQVTTKDYTQSIIKTIVGSKIAILPGE